MRITLDTEKGIFIVPNTFDVTLAKHNAILKKAGVETEITSKRFIEDAIKDAFNRPILTKDQAKDWNPDLENQIAK